MTDKPAAATGYAGGYTHLVRATCLYVATKLGDLMDHLVVVGGLVPSLLIDQDRLPTGTSRHAGTMDLDIGLDLAVFDDGRYRTFGHGSSRPASINGGPRSGFMHGRPPLRQGSELRPGPERHAVAAARGRAGPSLIRFGLRPHGRPVTPVPFVIGRDVPHGGTLSMRRRIPARLAFGHTPARPFSKGGRVFPEGCASRATRRRLRPAPHRPAPRRSSRTATAPPAACGPGR